MKASIFGEFNENKIFNFENMFAIHTSLKIVRTIYLISINGSFRVLTLWSAFFDLTNHNTTVEYVM